MKKNRLQKLVLNRETVRNLTKKDMDGVEGGKKKPQSVGKEGCVTFPNTEIPCSPC